MSFVLAAFLLLATIGDLRALRSVRLRGGARLSRPLWRMCFALFIAGGSFFSLRSCVAKVLPAVFTTRPDAGAADRAALQQVLLVLAGPAPSALPDVVRNDAPRPEPRLE